MVFDETGGVTENMLSLLMEIYDNIKTGEHKMSVVTENTVVSSTLHRYDCGTITFRPGPLPSVLVDIVDQNVAFHGYSAFSIRSLLPDGIEEVRGWIIEREGIRKVSPDDLIDAYCYDVSMEKYVTPNPNVRYSNNW